jgi:hypothetical protein
VFSYSVLQHFAPPDAEQCAAEIGRILRPAGQSLIQMAHRLGARGLYHQTRRGFRAARAFEVRYWSVSRLLATFERAIGPTSWSVDCFFGLGLQASDRRFLPWRARLVATASEVLRRFSERIPILRNAADSVFLLSRKSA